MRPWRRSNGVRPVVRLLMPGEEAVEGELVGRWDGHYHLEHAFWVSLGQNGMSRRRMDGHTAIQEAKALGYSIIGEVH